MSADTQMTDGKLWNTYLDVVQLARGLQSELTAARAEVEALRAALIDLRALVQGECPSLLDEDSGGDARLALAIDAALAKEKAS